MNTLYMMLYKRNLIVEGINLQREKKYGQNNICWICRNYFEITGRDCGMNKTCKRLLEKFRKYYSGNFVYTPRPQKL